MNTTGNIVIGLAVLAWLLWRQVQKRLVREDGKPTVLLILGVLGVVSLAAFFKGGGIPSAAAIALLAGSLLIAVLFGVVRAYTVRLWRADDQVWRQGTWLTVVLWLVAFAIHLGLDLVIDATSPVKGLGNASILLYLAVALSAQRLVVRQRANRQPGDATARPAVSRNGC